MTYNIQEELEYILHTIRHRDGEGVGRTPIIYLLEQATVHKSYPAKQVHVWGKMKEYNDIYCKIKDVLHIRIIEQIAMGTLDRSVGLKHLSAFYEYVEPSKVDITSKGEKMESVVFYIPSNGRDEKEVENK